MQTEGKYKNTSIIMNILIQSYIHSMNSVRVKRIFVVFCFLFADLFLSDIFI